MRVETSLLCLFALPNFIIKGFCFQEEKDHHAATVGPWGNFQDSGSEVADNILGDRWNASGSRRQLASLKTSHPGNELPFLFFLWIVVGLLLSYSLIYSLQFTFLVYLLDFRFMSPFYSSSWLFLVESSSSQWMIEGPSCPSLILIHSIWCRFYRQFMKEKN